MSFLSLLMTGQRARRPHLAKVTGEVGDLRRDLEEELSYLAPIAMEQWSNVALSDVDAIKASIASAAAAVTYSGTDLDGAVGTGLMSPPRNIIITLSNHADIDAVDVVVTGLDVDGAALTETITLTDGGNTTEVGLKAFAKVTQIAIPAQSGTGGALQFGFGNAIGLGRKLAARAGYWGLLGELVGGVNVAEPVVVEWVDLATADVDAIVETARATSASEDTLSGATIMDGVVGTGVMDPPRNVTITSDTHADFDAVDVVVTGTDVYDNVITDTISLTDGGNATDAGTVAFKTVTSLVVPAQGGTGGTYTVGFGVVVGLPAPVKYLAADPQVLLENDAGTPKAGDALANTYATKATTAPCGTVTNATAPDASNDYGLVYMADRGTVAGPSTAGPYGTYTPASLPAGGVDIALLYLFDPTVG